MSPDLEGLLSLMGNPCSVATRSKGTLRLGAQEDFPNATINENWKTAHVLGDKFGQICSYLLL